MSRRHCRLQNKKIEILIVPKPEDKTDVVFLGDINIGDIKIIEKALASLKRKKHTEGTNKLLKEIRNA